MKTLLLMLIAFFAATATGQENSCFPYCYRCEVVVVDVESKRKVAGLDFKPMQGEEELTQKILNIPGTDAAVHATVFFTDESLLSNAGYDSIRLALKMARKTQELKGGNNAIAEVTLNNFDTARVGTPIDIGNRRFVAVLECRALPVSNKEN